MENEQPNSPAQGVTNCSCGCAVCGNEWSGKCGGKWHKKYWKRHGGGGCQGGLWLVGWLFTVGLLKLAFWKGVLAIAIWPFYLGAFFAR